MTPWPGFGNSDKPATALLVALLLLTTGCLATAAYAPGFTGTFLFDDYPNLQPLETLHSDDSWREVFRFSLQGISSPSGRPISLLTFALQASDWPFHPAGFVRINFLLHLLNGLLLFWCLYRLAVLMGYPALRRALVPLAGAGLWLLAPIQVTAVLYIVQRMTELSATFLFAGTLMYLVGRASALQGSWRKGLLLMTAGLGTGAGLGTLAKENAALMPLLVAVTEFTLLARLPRPPHWRLWSTIFLGLPTVALVAYIGYVAMNAEAGYALRDYTPGQRLLTQARVLFVYLHKLLLPWPSGIKLLYDDFPKSLDLLRPWTTFASVLGVGGLLALAWRWRLRAPLLAFAILWFFAAHLLESSVLPLELAFEHRNYVASAGIWFAAAACLPFLWQHVTRRSVRVLLATFAIIYVALLCWVTREVATLWTQPLHRAVWWADKIPDSKRARLDLLGTLADYGLMSRVLEEAEEAAAHWPNDPAIPLRILQLSCRYPEIQPPATAELAARVKAAKGDALTVTYLIDNTLAMLEAGACAPVAPSTIIALAGAALDNPALEFQRQNHLLLMSRALKLDGRIDEARAYFRDAVEMRPVMILLFQGVLDEAGAGRWDAAWAYLEQAQSDPRIPFVQRWIHRHDIEKLRALLQDAQSRALMP